MSKTVADTNEIVKNSLMVCKNTYGYVAKLETSFADLSGIKVFPGDIGQVIVNLLVNSAHAIEKHQESESKKCTISVTTTSDKSHVIIIIIDSGGGTPERIKNRIFDPFFTTKELGWGSSQGLTISHTIIHDKHGGEMNFESEAGVEPTFTVKLPLNKVAPSSRSW